MQARIAAISCLTLCPSDRILGQKLSQRPTVEFGTAIA